VAKLECLFSVPLWEASSAISVMRMLTQQAEANIIREVKAADEPGSITEDIIEEFLEDEDGTNRQVSYTYYSCGSCVGNDVGEVKLEYVNLITQLTRRSAFLTIFALFEHRMSNCLELMIRLSGHTEELKGGTIEKIHEMLTTIYGKKGVADVDHLTIIRNIMAHADGVAHEYHQRLKTTRAKKDSEKRQLRAICKASEAVSVTCLNTVMLKDNFLIYAVDEISRYVEAVKTAVLEYHKNKEHPFPMNVR